MSGGAKYLLVGLPTNISLANEPDEALTALRSAVTTEYGTTYPFQIPTFKIGTLDALVQQADDLAKLANDCEAVVGRIADSLTSLLEGDQEKIQQQKNVNDKPVDQYLQTFTWNRIKYRIDKPLAELVGGLRKEVIGLDNDVKSKFSQYNTLRNNLSANQKKQAGNLSTKSLTSLVNPKLLVTDSEYLETHLLAVPKQEVKNYWKSYETICPMVVPRSSMEIATDSEFTLFAVTVFKKHGSEFIHKAREHRWVPRDFRTKQGGAEEEKKEMERLEKDERKVWGEALRLGRTGYSEAVMAWMHVMALRVFVESVLRYGLPASYICGMIRTTPKLVKRAKHSLDMTYNYLGGNAVSRDKKGRPTGDDQQMTQDMQQMGHAGAEEYTAYVYYELEVA